MAGSKGRGAGRKGRRGAPIRTPVEGDWLRCHKATGLAYVTGRKADGSPTRFYFGRYFAMDGDTVPSRDAVELAARWLREARVLGSTPSRQARSPLTVARFGAQFLEHARRYYGADSNEVQHYDLMLGLAAELYGSVPAEQFGPLALRALRDKMLESDRWARDTLNGHIGRLKRAFRWGVANELIPASTYEALRCVERLRKGRTTAREPGKVLPVSDEHVEAVLPRVSRQVRTLIELQRLTGARPGEIVLVRPCDIDREADPWVYSPAKHKLQHAGLSRTIYFGPKARTLLTPFLLREADDYCFSPVEAEQERLAARHAARKTPLEYGNSPGTNRSPEPEKAPGDRYTASSYRVAIQRACDRAGIPRWKPNQLRHTAATELRRKYGIEAARVTLGHTDASTTVIYAEADRDLAKKIAAECG